MSALLLSLRYELKPAQDLPNLPNLSNVLESLALLPLGVVR